MQTSLMDLIKDTAEGREADRILRSCVHCGFCLATCPTYQLLGDELDSPRGRIYLMKQMMEGHEVTARTQLHLDRCLTCRNCETTCPSGVEYGKLLDIGRHMVEERVPRSAGERWLRRILRFFLPRRYLFTPSLRLGQVFRPLLPGALRAKVPPRQHAGVWPVATHQRQVLILDGCVQSGFTPNTNAAAARVLDRLGITVRREPAEQCCGALSFHLNAQDEAKAYMRANIDAWWPHVEAGVEAIVSSASGCGVMVKDYGHVLADDPVYAEKARRISALTRDLGEYLAAQDYAGLRVDGEQRVAFHPPCTLQHGQKLHGVVEGVLRQVGFQLTPVPDAHLCCGSAGTYSITQPELSQRLLAQKLDALQSGRPGVIATANIGCQLHLLSKAGVAVVHWIELLDRHAVAVGTPARERQAA